MSGQIRAEGELAEHEVANAESELGAKLPVSYRRFLMSTGGGPLTKTYVLPEFDGSALLQRFYDARTLVRTQHRAFKEVIPRDYVAVGGGGGGAVCVKVGGDDVGSVWWADYDEAEDIGAEGPTQDVMVRQADDFSSFLELVAEQFRVGCERDV